MIVVDPVSLGDVTCTRASSAPYYDRNGVQQIAPPNTLRVTYDPNDLSRAPYALLNAGEVIGFGAGIVYSNAPIDVPSFNATTTYAKDVLVYDPVLHNVFQSLVANNVGKALTDTQLRMTQVIATTTASGGLAINAGVNEVYAELMIKKVA